MTEQKECYSEDAEQFNTMFLLGQSDEEEAREHPWNDDVEEEIDDYQAMHVLKWETGEAFCGAVSDKDDDRMDVTKLHGANSLNMIGVCDECVQSLIISGIISENSGIHVEEITEKTNLEHSRVKKIVDNLCELEYVIQVSDSQYKAAETKQQSETKS